jgi:hypothetical protein
MNRNVESRQILLFVLVMAILTVCAGFIFISCGKGPQLKIANPDKGSYALDFSECKGGATCRALLGSSIFADDPDKKIANKDLTIEAWVKSKGTVTQVGTSTPPTFNSTFTGGIFGRFDTAGIVLYVKNGVPKAAIRRVGATGTATATADYIVSSGMQILDNSWHHIAAVLTARDESAIHPDCGAAVPTNRTDTVDCTDPAVVCNNGIHLNIYVDGKYKDCNTTYGENNDTAVTQPAYAGEPGDVFVSVGVFAENLTFDLDGLNNAPFPGVIDEARLWGVARTQSQINQCKTQELSLDDGTCGRMTPSLISYLRLNEGAGSTINDWSGLGTGVLERQVSHPVRELFEWPTGWTTDTPDLKRAD